MARPRPVFPRGRLGPSEVWGSSARLREDRGLAEALTRGGPDRAGVFGASILEPAAGPARRLCGRGLQVTQVRPGAARHPPAPRGCTWPQVPGIGTAGPGSVPRARSLFQLERWKAPARPLSQGPRAGRVPRRDCPSSKPPLPTAASSPEREWLLVGSSYSYNPRRVSRSNPVLTFMEVGHQDLVSQGCILYKGEALAGLASLNVY